MKNSISKYFRIRQEIDVESLLSVLKLNLPTSYIGFGVKFNPIDIVGLVIEKPYMIGIKGEKRRLSVRFVDILNVSKYYEDDGSEFKEEPIVQIAGNNNPQGGIFLDLRDRKIYNLESSPFSILKEEREIIAESFDEFLESLKLYELSNKDLDYIKEIELKIPESVYRQKYKWE